MRPQRRKLNLTEAPAPKGAEDVDKGSEDEADNDKVSPKRRKTRESNSKKPTYADVPSDVDMVSDDDSQDSDSKQPKANGSKANKKVARESTGLEPEQVPGPSHTKANAIDNKQGEEDSDDEDSGQEEEEEEEEDMHEDHCRVCKFGGKLLCCDAPGCTAVYHIGCLDPPLKRFPKDDWFCIDCQDPLEDLEKILDVRAVEDEVEAAAATIASPTDKSRKRQSLSKETSARPSASCKTEYYVKLKERSYRACFWVPAEQMRESAKRIKGLSLKLRHFDAKYEPPEPEEGVLHNVRTEWTIVDRIIGHRTISGRDEYLVKWKELTYDESTWEKADELADAKDEIKRFKGWCPIVKSAKAINKRNQNKYSHLREGKRKFVKLEEQPDFLSWGALHPYQLEGLNWLLFAWNRRRHVILADEMGLGKTIQTVVYFSCLHQAGYSRPHLVITPLSVVRNWEREFAKWAPELNVITYTGNAAARQLCREYEFYGETQQKTKKEDRIKFHVLLISYEMVMMEGSFFKGFPWGSMVIDEGHRLKSSKSKLYRTIHDYKAQQRTLLTGTPLQNNLEELFMLLHFLDMTKFDSLEDFQTKFADIGKQEQIKELHKLLSPHILRRVKKDVLKDLPKKKELLVRVELSETQKKYYKMLLTRNLPALKSVGASHGKPAFNLQNVLMELRKCCCHPYLFDGIEQEYATEAETLAKMAQASGKLDLLHKMMPRLKAKGHRVLIYSQFTMVLDLLEDWLSLAGYDYERLDGSTSGALRQVAVDRFNAPNSSKFCFLLSTRAGGLGLNLATADTVIIFDSDWNPHNDLQAEARAHRMGQEKDVMIYRLVTRATVEEKMMMQSKKKMVLEHLVVQKMSEASQVKQDELDDILRYGARELFEEPVEGAADRIYYDEQAVERLCDRTLVKEPAPDADNTDEAAAENDYFAAFKVANFELREGEREEGEGEGAEAPKPAKAEEAADNEAPSFWSALLQDRYNEHAAAEAAKEESVEMGKGKREKRRVNYGEDMYGGAEAAMSDEYMGGASSSGSETEGEDQEPGEASSLTAEQMQERMLKIQAQVAEEQRRKAEKAERDRQRRLEMEANKQAMARQAQASLQPGDSSAVPVPAEFPFPLMQGSGHQLRVLGFTKADRTMFLNAVMHFGLRDFSWRDFVPALGFRKSLEEVKAYGNMFLRHISEPATAAGCYSDGVPKEAVQGEEVLARIGTLHLIHRKVTETFAGTCSPTLTGDLQNSKFRHWTPELDGYLLIGVLKWGHSEWKAIIDDPYLHIKEPLERELRIAHEPAVQAPVPPPEHAPTPAPAGAPTGVSPMPHQHVPAGDAAGPAGAPAPAADPSAAPSEYDKQKDPANARKVKEYYNARKMKEFLRKRLEVLRDVLHAEYSNAMLNPKIVAGPPPAHAPSAPATTASITPQNTAMAPSAPTSSLPGQQSHTTLALQAQAADPLLSQPNAGPAAASAQQTQLAPPGAVGTLAGTSAALLRRPQHAASAAAVPPQVPAPMVTSIAGATSLPEYIGTSYMGTPLAAVSAPISDIQFPNSTAHAGGGLSSSGHQSFPPQAPVPMQPLANHIHNSYQAPSQAPLPQPTSTTSQTPSGSMDSGWATIAAQAASAAQHASSQAPPPQPTSTTIQNPSGILNSGWATIAAQASAAQQAASLAPAAPNAAINAQPK